jgi:hypothetical protein
LSFAGRFLNKNSGSQSKFFPSPGHVEPSTALEIRGRALVTVISLKERVAGWDVAKRASASFRRRSLEGLRWIKVFTPTEPDRQ